MMSNNIKISYNINCVKHHIFWDIQNIIFKYRGIIFGGYVRDTIIREHYCNLYWKNEKNLRKDFNSLWNEKNDPETLPRTIVPNDVDVCLYEEKDVENMMGEITTIIYQQFGSENVKITKTLLSKDDNSYTERPRGSLHKYDYEIIVGGIPYICSGVQINIRLDIVVSYNRMMPPFNKLDFLCNGFVMTGNRIINLSSSTGTEIDKLSLLEKKEIEYKIIKDMVKFKTDYCMQYPVVQTDDIFRGVKYNEQAFKRIQKMVSRNNMWTIGNMPIIIEEYAVSLPKNTINYKSCCICCDNIRYKDKTVAVPVLDSNKNIIKGSQMHVDCFFKYLNSQIQNRMIEIEENSLQNYEHAFIKCPMRNYLDFNCKSIKNIIDKYLHS
jgi:hypothetical protein